MTILNQFGPVWIIQDHFEPFSTILDHFTDLLFWVVGIDGKVEIVWVVGEFEVVVGSLHAVGLCGGSD